MKRGYGIYKNIQEAYEKQTKPNQKIIDGFLEYCRISAGENSIKKIFLKIVQICDMIGKDLNKINLEDMRRFLDLLNKSNRATDTSNDTKKVLKRFLKWKYDDWNKRFNNFENIKQKRKTTNEKLSKEELLTSEEIEKLIRGSKDLKYKALIIVLFESAGRPEEIFNLRWKNINLENKEIKFSSSKTGDSRVVVIDQSVNRLALYKQEYPFPDVKPNDYVFPSPTRRGSPLSSQTFHLYLKRLGKNTIKKNVYCYLFRHTRLNSIRKKLSPDVYQKFAGHSMEVALEHYSHIDNDDVREEMFERIYNIEELTKEEKEEIKNLKKDLEELKKNSISKEDVLKLVKQALVKTEG